MAAEEEPVIDLTGGLGPAPGAMPAGEEVGSSRFPKTSGTSNWAGADVLAAFADLSGLFPAEGGQEAEEDEF